MVQQVETERLEAALAIVYRATAQLRALHDRYSGGGTGLREVAERLYSERRKRDAYFPAGLFGEPAWDLLLALFLAREDGRELTIAEACEAAGIGSREGSAAIDKLVTAGLVLRGRSGTDTRRNCVVLTDHGVERLSAYLTSLI